MTRRWTLRSSMVEGTTPADTTVGERPSLVQRVFRARGFTDSAVIARFCEPKLTHLHDPSLLPGVNEAAARLVAALRTNQSIAIYGDYDVDGITATAIIFHTLKTIAPNARVRHYVPHRVDEGYGINCDALRTLKSEGVDLVVSVDCGITAVRSAQTAREIGLELIITDHHSLPPEGVELPNALMVHPRLPGRDGAYPFGDLCGAGVAFKLAWRLCSLWCGSERVSKQLQELLMHLLPLAALGTIADVVPLVDENRTIAAWGLRLIKRTPLVGLQALITACGLDDEKIDSETVGFRLAPRLNACGRLGHATDAMRLLTEASPEEAMVLAQQLHEQNGHRQALERTIFEQATAMAEDGGFDRDDRRAIVLAHESWHPGVVGIVCSRMVERYGRPTVLLSRQNGVCKGSARSIDGYSIHAGIDSGREFLTTFGGHDMAAGLTFSADHLDAFTEKLIAHANANIAAADLMPGLHIDCEAGVEELTEDAVKKLQAMSPFGRGNHQPLICIREAILHEPPRAVGTQGKHLQLRLRQSAGGRDRWLKAVWFNGGGHAVNLASGMTLDLVIEPKLNHWQGRISVEAHVRDVRIAHHVAVSVIG